jgi:hypothetical protein
MSAYAIHKQKFPHARHATLVQKQREDATTEQLRREYRDHIDRINRATDKEIDEAVSKRSEGAVRRFIRWISPLLARID